MEILLEIIGWSGALLVLLAYSLNSFENSKISFGTYQTLNLVGGSLLMLYTYKRFAYASATVNLIWIVIAIASLYKNIKRNTKRQHLEES